MGADVAVLAPVAGKGAVHTGQAAAERDKQAALGEQQERVHWALLKMFGQNSVHGQPRISRWEGLPTRGASAVHQQAGRGDACKPQTLRGPMAGQEEMAFRALQGLCPSRAATLPPSSTWQADPARPAPAWGPSSRLWELYLGSLKGDFSKRRQNKGSAPQGNRGERA